MRRFSSDYTYRVPKVRQIPLRNSNNGYGYYSYPKTEIKYTFRPYNITFSLFPKFGFGLFASVYFLTFGFGFGSNFKSAQP
ncbi:hypothetical protein AAVH_29379 [Aphelenchoides avenae]|nr:hypothetical protein AAVH_29379 [Aphelenchus avenae]